MNKKIECIRKLIDNDMFIDLTEWLIENKFAKSDDFMGLARNKEKAECVYQKLNEAMAEEKLQLIDYEWNLLPLELIKITCITETEKKVFTYGY